ncbi:C40 family peptidase [Streptomyces sp. NPDC058964]|uniref:C40 family peptidase n=1 Tax=Streptomyces sp. NPDC058964 TaxID=3346681 RepID=UPI0036C1093C
MTCAARPCTQRPTGRPRPGTRQKRPQHPHRRRPSPVAPDFPQRKEDRHTEGCTGDLKKRAAVRAAHGGHGGDDHRQPGPDCCRTSPARYTSRRPRRCGTWSASSRPPAPSPSYWESHSAPSPDGYQIPANTAPAARTAIAWALQQLGTPYQWGGNCSNPHGTDPSGRRDCSSPMQRAYGVVGIQITRTTYTQVHDGRPVPANANGVQPGDLVFTEGSAARPEHVAMAIGDGLLVQAPRPGRVVEVAKVATHGTILVVRRMV